MAIDQINAAEREIERLEADLELALKNIKELTEQNKKYKQILDDDERAFYADCEEIVQTRTYCERQEGWSDKRYIDELKKQLQLIMPRWKQIQKIHKEMPQRIAELETRNAELEQERDRLNEELAKKARECEGILKTNQELQKHLGATKKDEVTLIIQRLIQERDEAVAQNSGSASVKERMHTAEDRVATLEEQNLQLNTRLQEEVRAKQEMAKRLEELGKILSGGGARLYKRLSENVTGLLHEEQRKNEELANEIKSLNSELELWITEAHRAQAKIAEIEGKFTEEDIKAVFAGFGINYGVGVEKGEREDLYNAVKKAKNIDKKNSKTQTIAQNGYNQKILNIVEAMKSYRTTESGKQAVTVGEVERILNDQMQEPSLWRTIVKSPLWVKLVVGFTALAIIGTIVGVSVNLSNTSDKLDATDEKLNTANTTIVNQNTTIDSQKGDLKEAEQQRAIIQVKGISDTMLENYNTVVRYKGYAEKLAKAPEIAEKIQSGKNISALSQSEEEVEEDGFSVITDAYNSVTGIISLDDEGKISSDCKVSVAVSNYEASVRNSNDAQAEIYLNEINGYAEEVKTALSNSDVALTTLLENTGFTVDDLEEYQTWQSIKAEPVTAVEFSESEIRANVDQLIARGLGGKVTSVEVANYEKATGKVTILANCETTKGKEYVNYITFTMSANMLDVSASSMMNAAKSATDFQVETFLADDVLTDSLGNKAYIEASNRFDKSTKLDVVEAKILVKAGNQVFSVSKSKQGDYLYEMIDGVKEDLVSKLIQQIDQKYPTAFQIAMEQVGGELGVE